MIKKENIIIYDEFKNKIMDEITKNSVYFDIETSGLSCKISSIVSITYSIYDLQDNQYKIMQYFASNDVEENEMLICFFNDVKNLKYAISYNGKTFDTNFIDEKFKKYNIHFSLSFLNDIDIYRLINNFRKQIHSENLKLKSVEELNGIYRADEICGEDVVTIFKAYQLNNNKFLADVILNHNYEDVVYLPKILDYAISLYRLKIFTESYGLILLKKITFQKLHLKAEFTCLDKGINAVYDSLSSKVTYNIKAKILTVSFDIKRYQKNDFKMIYTNNNFGLKNFDSIARLKKNIIPLLVNERDFEQNIHDVIKQIVKSNNI